MMSISNTLHANAAPRHFEQIAKILQSKRQIGDFSTCDLKIQLKNGYDMVHSMVVCAHSTVLFEALDSQRAPYQPFNMKDFETDSVKRVIDWMYSGEIDIPETSIADFLAVASFLRVTILQNQIEQKIRNYSGSPILALNIASARSFSVLDDTMNRLVHDLSDKVAGLNIEEVSKLTVNSVIAVMAAFLPMQKKVPLINMFILWIMSKKPEKETISVILQSLVISDITFDALYAIRYSLKQYLTNLEIASKSQLSISPSGTIGIKIVTKKSTKPSEKSASNHSNIAPPKQFHRTRSEISAIEKMPDPFNSHHNQPAYHTVSEINAIKKLPDPFEKSFNRNQSTTSILCRETNDVLPKYFTRSEVENLQQMTDPFSKSEKEIAPVYKPVYGFRQANCTAKYPGWSHEIIERNKALEREKQMKAKFTPSEAQMVRQIPDPFLQSGPVIMKSAIDATVPFSHGSASNLNGRKSMQDFSGKGANQSFSGHSLNNNYIQKGQEPKGTRPAVIVSSMSLASPNCQSAKSIVMNPQMTGPKKTESEIREINALPSFHSASFHTAQTSNKTEHSNRMNGKDEKSQKSQKSQKSLKSQKSQKSNNIPKSQYLYPN